MIRPMLTSQPLQTKVGSQSDDYGNSINSTTRRWLTV